ncbi:uncharacterized protein EV420DRAFT_1484166 [Desarmillaria tabescens]|uniref:Uncharacterized protein n=1 Tax=Armillaria tabescens TaxID=1929756 RepID=A0AA39JNW7_ARMTA|nr:uncharacterized protein EV420DRAFT_1484166 [Desarmillaria tabescens]KAK0445994.1 hypothetical protein EV420DRAFT_1484166 [Desarmillaria tabescens]
MRVQASYILPKNGILGAETFATSATVLEFGGEGVGDYAVVDGLFANNTLHICPGTTDINHSLTRKPGVKKSQQASQTDIDMMNSNGVGGDVFSGNGEKTVKLGTTTLRMRDLKPWQSLATLAEPFSPKQFVITLEGE